MYIKKLHKNNGIILNVKSQFDMPVSMLHAEAERSHHHCL